ncbi:MULTISPECIES: dihydroxy-acid dehydratase [Streptomyces]|jgi:dihydroxy-acid dehydratase|uniref:dihydroxy-acid dehydratase n=1 Tax=unclassified Streptomyces TaxID=2593676 RepID=UPI00088BA8A8|nr:MULTISPECIES: dihydroxy-acid dehydratase [unclassified Streptomyces]SCY12270.1 dihydroxyacid dehydratase [Streptomyces sp. 136MFCol5.1]SFS91051.1 dihydroxy-acid dehydratase [Streptomyces sp. ok210]
MTALRSNYTPGTSPWAVRRAQWRALGLTDEDMDKPKIAIVNSSSQLATCYSHLDEIARAAKEAIAESGGIGFEIRTVAPSDFIHSAGGRGGYILSARDLITHDIEAAVEGAQLDGMLTLASCDKTAPGQLMAAARLDLPTVVVGCGYQACGTFAGRHCDIEDVFLAAGHHAQGRIGLDELTGMSENAVAGPGVCAGMGTANSMHIACEALGMALPGSTPVLANSPRMWADVRAAGRRIVDLVREDLRPRTLLTRQAFENAVTVMLAVSASINSVKHLQAIAEEAHTGIDVYEIYERLADKVPLLAAVRPNGPYSIDEFEAAGGASGVLWQLRELLHTGALTITGRTLGEELTERQPTDPEVIRPPERALGRGPTIVLVRGSLAPATGIVKLAVDEERPPSFTGPAKVYDSPQDALDGLRAGDVLPGQVLVLRGLGPKGTPGMGMASRPVFALDGAGLTGKVAVVTDGQLSGLVNKGIVVGEVSPEAADAGPLALVRDGDTISIDLTTRCVDLLVPDEELATRTPWTPCAQAERGWLSVYLRTVRPLQEGAVLTPRTPREGITSA